MKDILKILSPFFLGILLFILFSLMGCGLRFEENKIKTEFGYVEITEEGVMYCVPEEDVLKVWNGLTK